jgi:hypothetical protein
LGNYPLEFHPLNQYPFEGENMDHCHIAAWFTLHGILPEHEDFHHLRSFAQSARRQAEGPSDDDSPGQFASGYPRSATDVESLSADTVIPWRAIDFGMLRDGLETSVPSRPGITSDSEMPTPPPEDDEMEPGSGTGDDDKLIY